MLDSPPAAPTPLETALLTLCEENGWFQFPLHEGGRIFRQIAEVTGLKEQVISDTARRLGLWPSDARLHQGRRVPAADDARPEEWARRDTEKLMAKRRFPR